jgi:pimeloyl-ACP methyl ester carboxylesterase
MMATVKNVVLVHGGFVDGAGWEAVYKILKKNGYHVSVVQNPTISLADDAAVTSRVLAAQDGPTVLVGHSYGGVVTEAGTHPKWQPLVYITAFAPDTGSRYPRSSRIRRPAHRCRQFSRRRMASLPSTRPSSTQPSRRT